MQPKFVVKSFKLSANVPVIHQMKMQKLMEVVDKSPEGPLLRKIFNKMEDKDRVLKSLQEAVVQKEFEMQSGFEHWMAPFSNDFFGLFHDFPLEKAQTEVINMYRYCFRFSIEKLVNFTSDPTSILLVVQYIKLSQMGRIHRKECLQKNAISYYKAVENLLNNSMHNRNLLNMLA